MNAEQYLENKVRPLVAQHGFMVQAVGDNPPFSYTVGLLETFGYEVIVFMLDMINAHTLIHNIVRELKRGVQYEPGRRYPENKVIEHYPIMFMECDPAKLDGYVNIAKCYWDRDDVAVRQLVLCDRYGNFPGDTGYSMGGQPLLY